MAIVFVSAKESRRIFLKRVAIVTVFIATVAFLVIFIPKFFNVTEEILPSQAPSDIAIDLSIINSSKFKNLETVNAAAEQVFVYTVQDKDNKQITGNILAVNEDSARILLEKSGFNVLSLKQMPIGKSNPFAAY